MKRIGQGLTALALLAAACAPYQAKPSPSASATTAPSQPPAPAEELLRSDGNIWVRTFVEEFTATSKPAVWYPYDSPSGGGKYNDAVNTSYPGGVMRIDIRNVDGVMSGTAGQFGESLNSMRKVTRFRCPKSFTGAGAADMIWPDKDIWGNGEIDFPEMQFDSTIRGYVHELGEHPERNALAIDTGVATCGSDWHTAVAEWVPGKYVRFILDGQEVGRNTTHVPTTPHSWRFQAADNGGPDSDGGVIELDWVAQYRLLSCGDLG